MAAQTKVFAPIVVGRPPSDSYIGLVRLPSGEIRHYNYGEQAESDDPLYIFSLDGGFTWQTKFLPKGAVAADQRSPVSGEYIRLFQERGTGVMVARSKGGMDGEWEVRKVWPNSGGMLKPPVFIRGGKRILVACQFPRGQEGLGNQSGSFYSDDDGLTWKLSNLITAPLHQAGGVHKAVRWQNGGCEPTVVELKDGRVWMLMRTSQDNLYESYSRDGGETWEEPRPSRFYSTITMPTAGRLKDGRILLLWNNTTPLPEVERDEATRFLIGTDANEGVWEDVFTNRDAVHAAVSSDEGRTWQGFREFLLNPRRNDRDYGETGGIDRSVHQSQFVELDQGVVLVAVGQHRLHRSLVQFHPDWLLEKSRSSRFENGLDDWSVHSFVAGIRGHCAFNRKVGASLTEHPDLPGRKVLHVRRLKDRSLVSENQGVTWNFPAGLAGTLKVRIRFEKDGHGGRISLIDRWINPTDPAVDTYAMYTMVVNGNGDLGGKRKLEPGRWHDLRFEWSGLAKSNTDSCRLFIDGSERAVALPLKRPSVNGISYVHFQSTATTEDTAGFLVESVEAEVK